jgi:hypothetical protein
MQAVVKTFVKNSFGGAGRRASFWDFNKSRNPAGQAGGLQN